MLLYLDTYTYVLSKFVYITSIHTCITTVDTCSILSIYLCRCICEYKPRHCCREVREHKWARETGTRARAISSGKVFFFCSFRFSSNLELCRFKTGPTEPQPSFSSLSRVSLQHFGTCYLSQFLSRDHVETENCKATFRKAGLVLFEINDFKWHYIFYGDK